MGMNFGKGKKRVISEINVTPLVDVMLVLLVIFMITAPLMLNGIKLELPKTKEVNPINLNSSQVILSLTKSNILFLGEKKIEINNSIDAIMKKLKKEQQNVLFIRADYEISYGKVARLMSFLKRGGVTNLALVTELEGKKEK